MWWPFSSKNTLIKTPEGPEISQDWSLRANPDHYLDQANESQILLNRLINSSASVTGIAGQRGAGKSSLALKVLEAAKERGAFTLLIHSPTGYDSWEFLVSVFQRICEEVISRMNQKFGQAKSLSDIGAAERRRLSRTLWTITIGIFSIFFVISIYQYKRFLVPQGLYATAREEENQSLKSRLSEIQKKLSLYKNKPFADQRR